jgi:hypothetical protein
LDPYNGPNQLCIPDIEDLKEDLTIPKWTVKPGAIIEIEPKDSVVKRLGRSPDCGDCVVMTVWPDTGRNGEHRLFEYSQPDYIHESWAEDPHPKHEPLDRRKQRLERLGEKVRERQAGEQHHVFAYSSGPDQLSGWEEEPWL